VSSGLGEKIHTTRVGGPIALRRDAGDPLFPLPFAIASAPKVHWQAGALLGSTAYFSTHRIAWTLLKPA
jgi:hypothetical protein